MWDEPDDGMTYIHAYIHYIHKNNVLVFRWLGDNSLSDSLEEHRQGDHTLQKRRLVHVV